MRPEAGEPTSPWASRSRRRAAAVGWTAAIVVLCLIPSGWLGLGAIERGRAGLPLPSPDKLVHFALFGGFALLWSLACWPARYPARIAAAGIALVLGTEWAQNLPFIARDGNLPDALADTIGLLVGSVAAPWIARRWEALRAPAGDPEKISR